MRVTLAKIHRFDARIVCDLIRRASGQQRAFDQHSDALGKRKHQVHIMLDQQDSNVAWQPGYRRQQIMPLGLRHPGGGLIQ
jgi:hypothetical protein